MLSPYKQLQHDWLDCTRCELHECRSNVVLVRGNIPCEVLFIGEAPGRSEDSLGRPFVGPAGELLDIIIERAIARTRPFRYAIDNMVACIPFGPDEEIAQPTDDHVEACRERLETTIKMCRPRLIVCVGKVSEGWFDRGYKHSIKTDRRTKIESIAHPASILRANESMRTLLVQRQVLRIVSAIEDLDEANKGE